MKPKSGAIDPKIDLLSIEKQTYGVAEKMFKDWSRQCYAKYPGMELILIDKLELVYDVLISVSGAVDSLLAGEKKRKFSDGGEVAFIYSFINSYLNSRWHHEYLIKKDDKFKSIVALKTLAELLDEDTVLYKKVKRNYQKNLRNEVNFTNIDTLVAQVQIEINNGIKEVRTGHTGTVKTILTNMINSTVFRNFPQNRTDNFDLKPEKYFKEKDIRALIEINRKKLSAS